MVILGIKRHFVFMRATLLLSNEYFDGDCSRIPILNRCFNLFLYQKEIGPRLVFSPFQNSNFILCFCHSSIYFLCYRAYLGSECNFLHKQNMMEGYYSPMSLRDC